MNNDQVIVRGTRGIGAVAEFLKRRRARYGLIEHAETFAAVDRNILCSGGDHRHTLTISPREIERLGEPLVADICEQRPAHRTKASVTH
jgi:hypothetical protein